MRGKTRKKMTLFLAISNKADRKEIVCGKGNWKPVKKSYDHSENRDHTHTRVRGKSSAATENGQPHRVSRNENRAPEKQQSTSCYHIVDWVIREQTGTQQHPTRLRAVGGIFVFDFVFELETVLQSCIVCLVLHLVAQSEHERSGESISSIVFFKESSSFVAV